jgi:hypothetical protein
LGDVLAVADNRHELRVGVRNREDHSIRTRIESGVEQLGEEALLCAEMPAAPMRRTRRVEYFIVRIDLEDLRKEGKIRRAERIWNLGTMSERYRA